MKNDKRVINLLDVSQIKHRTKRSDKIKTTDINILLNRVRLTRKIELKKKIIFGSLLLISTIFIGIIYLN